MQLPFTKLSEPKILHLHIADAGVYINNIEIVSKRSVSRFNVIHVLLDQFWKDFRNGLPAEKYTLLNINQLAERLGFNSGIHNLEYKVRRPLNRINNTTKKKLSEQFGLHGNDIIESIGWPGYSRTEHGYRLNPFILSLGAAVSYQFMQSEYYKTNLPEASSALSPLTPEEDTAFNHSNAIKKRRQNSKGGDNLSLPFEL